MCWDVQGNKFIQVAAHDQPIKYVGWMNENGGILCTGSWDNSLRYWDMRQQAPICTVNLGNKLYCMDIKWPLGIACTSDRKIHIFNMQQPQNPVNVRLLFALEHLFLVGLFIALQRRSYIESMAFIT